MGRRRERIGEYATTRELPWATSALGPVPDDPAERLDWTQRGAAIGTYRVLFGVDDPSDTIGPELMAARYCSYINPQTLPLHNAFAHRPAGGQSPSLSHELTRKLSIESPLPG
jgi:hypothetical protein